MKNKDLLYIGAMIFGLLAFAPSLWAQPANDECEGAVEIANPANYCSENAEFTLVGATESGYDPASCWTDDSNDVWFRFVAIAKSVTVTVNGASGFGAGGSLRFPDVALYAGTCGLGNTINQLECATDIAGDDFIELRQDGLLPGATYWIRVDGRFANIGTFQLCVRNFNPPVSTSSDGPTSAILCDKSTFVVPTLEGGGLDDTELEDAPCFAGGLPGVSEEFNSVWFRWTCDQAGSLTFSLTPLNPIDDLDFVLYEMTGGIDNCNSRRVLRCEAAGEDPVLFPSPCHGPTGLNTTANDVNEDPGCDNGQDNFLQLVNMEAGRSYMLAINNFGPSTNGVEISFGGTGTFLGPQVDFTSSPSQTVCYGQSMTFTDASTFALGSLVAWEWSFGVDAIPETATGRGPHDVTWSTPGLKSITLTVQTDRGCVVTEVATILVSPCCDDFNAMTVVPDIVETDCPNSSDGSILLSVDSNAPDHLFDWENGASSPGINNLEQGDYTVTITNEATCDTVLTFSVEGPPPFEPNPIITMPTCMGGTDGAILLDLVGGTPPYQYNWGSGFTADNTLSNLPIGIYTVTIQDVNGCEEVYDIPVNELELQLSSDIPAIVPPSCHDTNDGSITLVVANGQGPYTFDYNDGNGFVSTNTVTGINNGVYTITFQDANGCFGDTILTVTPPQPLSVIIDPIDISCFSADDGSAVPIVSGGVGGYQFSWSDFLNQTDSIATDLQPGDYFLTVTDANGCDTIAEVTIVEPPELFLDLVGVQDVICFGDTTGQITVSGIGGTPDYEYSLDGVNFQGPAIFNNLLAGDYTVVVMDAMGCTNTVDATITEPPELIVTAGQDQTVELGYTANLSTNVIPPFQILTYQWSPTDFLSCSECPAPAATGVNNIVYTVTVTDEQGCTATDDVAVNVIKNRPIFIPNAFSPNVDGANDFFTIYGGPGASEVRILRVFNRWGALIFENNNFPLNEELFGWDGTFKGQALPPDVFAYYAIVGFIDGEEVLFEGDISLIK
ncbi:MAG: gliding motility-associated C-terminal domain-containing protein [Bacteroidota bacterium]